MRSAQSLLAKSVPLLIFSLDAPILTSKGERYMGVKRLLSLHDTRGNRLSFSASYLAMHHDESMAQNRAPK